METSFGELVNLLTRHGSRQHIAGASEVAEHHACVPFSGERTSTAFKKEIEKSTDCAPPVSLRGPHQVVRSRLTPIFCMRSLSLITATLISDVAAFASELNFADRNL